MWKVGKEHFLKKYYQDANLENISWSDIIYSFWPKTDLFVTIQCLFRKRKLIFIKNVSLGLIYKSTLWLFSPFPLCFMSLLPPVIMSNG